jgi:hypothetical protein
MVAFLTPPAFIRPRKRLFFVGQAGTFSTSTSTLTDVSFGPSGTKRVWYGVSWSAGENRGLLTITIGGVSATRVIRAIDSGAVSNAEVWYADVSAASGTIVMNWTGSIAGGRSVVWYSDTNISTTETGVFSDANSGTSFSTTADTRDTGFLIAVARWQNLATGRTFTWSGADVVSGDNNGAFGESFAMVDFTNVETARAVSGSLTSNSTFRRLAVVAAR